MAEIRYCQICNVSKGINCDAYADAKILGNCWWYPCHEHFDHYGCVLGEGRGRLVQVG